MKELDQLPNRTSKLITNEKRFKISEQHMLACGIVRQRILKRENSHSQYTTKV